MIDMTPPGVTVRPIETIDGIHHLNEVFFEDARVPVANRIGEEGKGWTYAKSLLVHERLSIAEVAESKRSLDDLREMARAEVNGGVSLLNDPFFAKRIADVEVDLMALEFTELRVLAAAAEGGMPGPESSLLKLQGTDIQQALQELRMDVAGYYSGALQGDLPVGQFGHDFELLGSHSAVGDLDPLHARRVPNRVGPLRLRLGIGQGLAFSAVMPLAVVVTLAIGSTPQAGLSKHLLIELPLLPKLNLGFKLALLKSLSKSTKIRLNLQMNLKVIEILKPNMT